MMKLASVLACAMILVSLATAEAVEIVIDDFEGGAVVAGRTITPTVGTMTSVADMFQPAQRSLYLDDVLYGGAGGHTTTNTLSMPWVVDDATVSPSAGNSQFLNDSFAIFGQYKTDGFFGVSDTVNGQNPDPEGDASVEWTVGIAGLSNLSLSIDVGAMGDFEDPDDIFSFSVSIDGVAPTIVMNFQADETNTAYTYRPLDSQLPRAEFDGVPPVDGQDLAIWQSFFGLDSGASKFDGDAHGDGDVDGDDFLIWQRDFGKSGEPTTLKDPLVYLGPDGVMGGGDDVILDKSDRDTGEIDTITVDLNSLGTGTTLTLRFDARTNGSEAFAFDNIILSGDAPAAAAVPEPGSWALLGLALGLVPLARRRRYRR